MSEEYKDLRQLGYTHEDAKFLMAAGEYIRDSEIKAAGWVFENPNEDGTYPFHSASLDQPHCRVTVVAALLGHLKELKFVDGVARPGLAYVPAETSDVCLSDDMAVQAAFAIWRTVTGSEGHLAGLKQRGSRLQ